MLPTLQLSGLGTRLAGPARLLASHFGRKGGAVQIPDLASVAAPAQTDLKARLHAPLLPRPPEADLWDQTVAEFAVLAADQRWAEVLAALRAADQSRATCAGGRSCASLISKGARQALTSAMIAAQTADDWQNAEAEVGTIAAMQSAHSQDYTAACLLAQAHLDYGWARRCAASTKAGDVPRDFWNTFLRHTGLAEATLEPYDPIEEFSPLLAGTRYLLIRGMEDGEELCRDWYEDWSDLDPANPEPHSTHAPHLLPHWFGTLAGFDGEALAASKRTRTSTGATAYALFYLAATDALGDLPPGLDLPLFLQGLADFQAATGCQYRANIIAAALADLDHSLSQDANNSRRHQEVRKALDGHLRNTLREFHLSTWNKDQALIHYALSQVFAEDLTTGAHIHAGPSGLIARRPS